MCLLSVVLRRWTCHPRWFTSSYARVKELEQELARVRSDAQATRESLEADLVALRRQLPGSPRGIRICSM